MSGVSGCKWLETCIRHTPAQIHSYLSPTFRHKKVQLHSDWQEQWANQERLREHESVNKWEWESDNILVQETWFRIHAVLTLYLAEQVGLWILVCFCCGIYLSSNVVGSWWMTDESQLTYPCGGVCIITQLFSLINMTNRSDYQQVLVSFSIFSISNSAHLIHLFLSFALAC